MFDARGARLTAALRDLAELDGVTFVDNFSDRGLRDIRYWSPDKLHLNSLGHARVASNVLTEIARDPVGLDGFNRFLGNVREGSLAILIEPGAESSAVHLAGWRRMFVGGHPGWSSLGPCGQEFGKQLPRLCDGCWSARRDMARASRISGLSVIRWNWWEKMTDSTSIPFMRITRVRV